MARNSAGRRWYMRSDGSHPYALGNTHYSFLSGCRDGGQPTGKDIAQDIAANAAYFKKLRFTLHCDRHNEGDTIEAHTGAFLGGGYGTTGWKTGNKLGHYFWGKFSA